MALHEFRCEKCEAVFEELVREGTKVVCPQCGSAKVEQLLSAFSAHSKSSAPACASGACPGATEKKSPCCGGGKCPFH